MSSKLMAATMNADKTSEVSSPHKLQFGYQGQAQMPGSQMNQGPLSPKTEGDAPKLAGLGDGTKHAHTD